MKYDLSKIEFKNEKRYLSNMWKCNIEYNGLIYPSSEHLYQALKSDNLKWHNYLLNLTPEQTKTAARKKLKTLLSNEKDTFLIKENFHKIKKDLMLMIVRLKFQQNPELAEKLIKEKEPIEERNCWGDVFWGTVDGIGKNHLGNILMQVKNELILAKNKQIQDKDSLSQIEYKKDNNSKIYNRFNFETNGL